MALSAGAVRLFPDRPFVLGGVRDFGEKRKRKLLDMRADAFVREQAGKLPHVPVAVSVTEIGQYLSDLSAPEQMLLRPFRGTRPATPVD